MVNYVSPGVYTIEKDISDYTPSINTSIVGVVGFAGKGPTNKATLITSQNNLVNTFGAPSESLYGQGLEGALEILEQTNSLYFVRAATSAATDASAQMAFGTCPSVIVSGPAATGSYDEGFGLASSIYLKIQVYDNEGAAQFVAPQEYSVPAGTLDSNSSGASQAKALAQVLGGGLDADAFGVFDDGNSQTGLDLSGAIVGSFAGSGASIGVSAYNDSAFTVGFSALRPVYGGAGADAAFGVSGGVAAVGFLASAVRAFGATYLAEATNGASSCQYLLESIHPGAGYNGGTKANGDTSGNSITIRKCGGPNFFLDVNEDGVALESFKPNFLASGTFIEELINTGETNLTSNIIKGNIFRGGVDATVSQLNQFSDPLSGIVGTQGFKMSWKFLDPATNTDATGTASDYHSYSTAAQEGGRWIKLVPTTTSMAGGDDGTGTTAANNTALIGNAAVDPKTGMQSLDDDVLNIGIALVPGVYNQSVQNSLITLAESTQNFIALVSPPYAIGPPQDAIDWTNGKSSSTAGVRTAAINSSYAAVYYPHVKVFSTFDSKDRWYDPAIFGARQMAYTDTVADSWFAPAGFRRGRLTKPVDVEVKLNQGDRDSLYSGGNVVNPIVSFPQQGITIFGQRTSQRSPTALDRINIRRLMIYIRKVILIAARRFVFEPNDEFTWTQIEGLLNPFLDDIKRRRGITEFRVVCDDTVNTPVRIDRNELWTKVIVKPTKTAEILIFEINLTNQSAQLGNL